MWFSISLLPDGRQVAAGCVFVFTQLLSAVPGLLSAGASPCAGDSRLLVPRRADPSCLPCALLLLLLLMPASRYSAAQAATLPPAHADTLCATTLHSFAGLLLLTHFLAHAAALCCPTLLCPAKNHMLFSVQEVNLPWMTVCRYSGPFQGSCYILPNSSAASHTLHICSMITEPPTYIPMIRSMFSVLLQ